MIAQWPIVGLFVFSFLGPYILKLLNYIDFLDIIHVWGEVEADPSGSTALSENLLKFYVNGKEYKLYENPMDISKVSFSFSEKRGTLTYNRAGSEKKIEFGFGEDVSFSFPETHYYGEQIGVPSGKKYRAYGSAGWVDESTLMIRVATLDDYLGRLTMRFSFKDDDVSILMGKNAEWFFDEYQGLAGGKMSKN